MANEPKQSSTSVIACNPRAIDASNRENHIGVAQDLFSPSTVLEVKELPNGYGFRLPLQTPMLHKAINFIANERLCCPFFTFTLIVGEQLWLELRGEDEVKDYIKENIVKVLETTTFPTVEELEIAYIAATSTTASTD